MTVSLPFPGGRTLAGWWRQLASFQPTGFWVGHLLVHRVEALARVRSAEQLEPLAYFVLRGLALEGTAPRNNGTHTGQEKLLQRLDERLHLGAAVLLQILRGLAHRGLARFDPHGGWTVTDAGRQTLPQGELCREQLERQTFYFLEPEDAGAAPAFLPLLANSAAPWSAGAEWTFDLQHLRACLAQPPEWKQRHSFPTNVVDLAREGDLEVTTVAPWQRVVIHRPEHLAIAVVRTRVGELLGFAVKEEGWVLDTAQPVLKLAELADGFAELTRPADESWQRAWLQWCQQRSMPAEEALAAMLTAEEAQLKARVPGALLERLRAGRGEALKGGVWLLSGAGRLRAAAQLEITGA
jgi:hypothetical protein